MYINDQLPDIARWPVEVLQRKCLPQVDFSILLMEIKTKWWLLSCR